MNPLCSTLHKIRGIATIDLGWVVIDMNSFTVVCNCFLLGCSNLVEGELMLHPNGYNVFPFCCAVERAD
jgi:hypothetical protein